MQDGLQFGTLGAILFGILLNRYDAASLRKEMNDLRKDMNSRFEALRSEVHRDIADLRAEVHRVTGPITELLFQHAERVTKLESKP